MQRKMSSESENSWLFEASLFNLHTVLNSELKDKRLSRLQSLLFSLYGLINFYQGAFRKIQLNVKTSTDINFGLMVHPIREFPAEFLQLKEILQDNPPDAEALISQTEKNWETRIDTLKKYLESLNKEQDYA